MLLVISAGAATKRIPYEDEIINYSISYAFHMQAHTEIKASQILSFLSL